MVAKFDPDLEMVEKVCQLHPTDIELAAFFNVSVKTIQRKKKNRQFAEAMDKGKGKALLSLRRKQMKVAEAGNVRMLIWLGKQLLGQADKQQLEASITQAADEDWNDV